MMIDVAVRLIAAFLAHPTHGVNAMAQGLPRTQLASASVDPPPPAVNVYNDADHEIIATTMTPPESPALMVWGDSSADSDVKDVKTAKNVVIAIAYVTRDDVDAFTQNRACGYLMRGAKRTLRRYRQQAASDGYRELNGIRILDITRVNEQRITMAGEGGTPVVWGWLAVHATVVDSVA